MRAKEDILASDLSSGILVIFFIMYSGPV